MLWALIIYRKLKTIRNMILMCNTKYKKVASKIPFEKVLRNNILQSEPIMAPNFVE